MKKGRFVAGGRRKAPKKMPKLTKKDHTKPDVSQLMKKFGNAYFCTKCQSFKSKEKPKDDEVCNAQMETFSTEKFKKAYMEVFLEDGDSDPTQEELDECLEDETEMKMLEETHEIKDKWVCDSTDYEMNNMFAESLAKDNDFAKLLKEAMSGRDFTSLI